MYPVIVRLPPSPTGLFHIGTARTVLYNYLFAKKHGGKIVMRLEDTDKERSKKEFEENILAGIKKLGMSWDGEVIRQSERTSIYTKYLHELLDTGHAYFCFASSEELDMLRKEADAQKKPFRYPNIWRNKTKEEVQAKLDAGEKYVIRFKIPEHRGDISFDDSVRGNITISANELDDFVIAKNFETPLYNFCVVVDDHEMNISHVIRGEDHIPNTPKQIVLYEAFGWNIPIFAHIPLILNADKSKLSKRKNDVSVDNYLADGYLPEALINFLALLGWNTSDEQEIFSMEELIKKFSLERVHKNGAIFDLNKLLFLNGYYIRQKTPEEFAKTVEKYWEEYTEKNPF